MEPRTVYTNDTKGTIDACSIISSECLTPGQMVADLAQAQARAMTQQAFSYGQREQMCAHESMLERLGK